MKRKGYIALSLSIFLTVASGFGPSFGYAKTPSQCAPTLQSLLKNYRLVDSNNLDEYLSSAPIKIYSEEVLYAEALSFENAFQKGGGNSGLSLFLVSGSTERRFVKWIQLRHTSSETRILREARFAQLLSDFDIGPKFYGIIREKNRIGLVSQNIQGTFVFPYPKFNLHGGSEDLPTYSPYYNLNTLKKMEEFLKIFHKAGIIAYDLQVILSADGRPWVIDAGNFLSYKGYQALFKDAEASPWSDEVARSIESIALHLGQPVPPYVKQITQESVE